MNRKAKLFIDPIMDRQRQYLAENQRDWDIQARPLTYVYYAQAYHSTNLTIFGWALSQELLDPSTVDNQAALLTDEAGSTSLYILQARLLHRLWNVRQDVGTCRKTEQGRSEGDYDKWIYNTSKMMEIGNVSTSAATADYLSLKSRKARSMWSKYRWRLLQSTEIEC